MRRVTMSILLILMLLGSLPSGCSETQQPAYRLAVVVVVDQMRPDYLTRFGPDFNGGLHRLLGSGAFFTEAYHDHAATETAVGHATIGTGMTPSHHGIVANDWYDRRQGREVYACEDSTVTVVGHPDMAGRSPRLLAMPTVGDWLKKRSPESKVLAMALKDRAAINMGGHYPDAVYWYSRNDGRFVTSTFYMDTTPVWVDSFNTSGQADRYLADGWSGDEVEGSFSHPFDTVGRGMKGYYRDLYGAPFSDHLLLDFAGVAVDRMELGKDDVPDILFVSCSAADVIGHTYGPDSPEVHDYYNRLDRALGKLLAHLDTAVGNDRYFVVLASDHGVMTTPEVLRMRGIDARRISPRVVDSTVEATLVAVEKQFHLKPGVMRAILHGEVIDTAVARAAGVSLTDLENTAAAALRKAPFLQDVYTVAELTDPDSPARPYMNLYRNVVFPGRGEDLKFQFIDHCLITDDSTGTSHGSPYHEDTHVPIVVCGPGIAGGVYDDSVRSVDIAPSLFELLGYDPPEGVDGRSLISRLVK